jgi:hypothetical protein
MAFMTTQQQQIDATLQTIKVLADAIRESPNGIPSGHLYAVATNTMSLATYQSMIDMLKRAKLVSEKNYLLTWMGPRF